MAGKMRQKNKKKNSDSTLSSITLYFSVFISVISASAAAIVKINDSANLVLGLDLTLQFSKEIKKDIILN
jgi:hypothetical protein